MYISCGFSADERFLRKRSKWNRSSKVTYYVDGRSINPAVTVDDLKHIWNEKLYTNFLCKHIKQLMSVQQVLWPSIAKFKNVIGIAKKGQGKTCAYLVPIINNILMGEYPKPPDENPLAVVIVPTWKQAVNVLDMFHKITDGKFKRRFCFGFSKP